MAIVKLSTGQTINFEGNPTQADIDEVVSKMVVSAPKTTPNLVGFNNLFGGTSQLKVPAQAVQGAVSAFKQKEQATFNPLKIADKYFTSIGEATVGAIDKVKDLFTEPMPQTKAGKIAKTGEAGLATINSVLSPISSAFKAGEAIPGLGYVATGVNALFGAIGGGSSAIADNALNQLPVSDQTKEELRPFVNEAGALAGQILAGKAGLDAGFAKANAKVLETLNNGFKRELPPEISAKMPEVKPIEEAPIMPVEAPKLTVGESKVVSEANPLIQEAKKYKTAEEFVKAQGEDTITLYRAAPKFPKDKFEKGTYFADDAQKARYYSESHYNGNPNDIKVEQFTVPKNTIFKEPSTGNYITTGEATILKTKSQLTDIWNKAQEVKTEVQPEIPQTQPSGIAKKIEANAIEKGLTESGFDELAGYDASTKKAQAELGSKYDINQHIDMVKTGNLPKGIKPGTPFSIVEKYANETKNVELQRELAKSPLATKISESASELSLSRMREKDSAVQKIKEVIDSRKEKFKEQIKTETTKIKKSIGKPTKESWLKFIEEIKC